MTHNSHISQIFSMVKVQILSNTQDQVSSKYNKHERLQNSVVDSVQMITKSHISKMDRVDQSLVDKLCGIVI